MARNFKKKKKKRKNSYHLSCQCFSEIFINLWLHWVFTVMHGLSLVAESRDYSLVGVHGLFIAVASLVSCQFFSPQKDLKNNTFFTFANTSLLSPFFLGKPCILYNLKESSSSCWMGCYLIQKSPNKDRWIFKFIWLNFVF